jgi:Ca-activated chloride channel family protein
MRKLLPVVLSGAMAVSYSYLAAAQSVGVQGPAGTGANVDLGKQGTNVSPDLQNNQQIGQGNQSNQQQGSGNQAQNTQQSGEQNQNAQQQGRSQSEQGQSGSGATGGSAGEDKNPRANDKGWAKGHERGKGHGANDERHGGRHRDDASAGSGSSSDSDRQRSRQRGEGNQSNQQQGDRNQAQNTEQSEQLQKY